MKQTSIYHRWQLFLVAYEDKKKKLENDPKAPVEVRYKRVTRLQRAVIAGLDELEQSIKGEDFVSEPESPRENLAKGGN